MSCRYRSLRNELICRTVLIFLPLLTTAHVSRVLGAEGMGITAVSLNVISYFIMMSQLGTHTLGIRTAAQNPAGAERTYQDLLSLQILTSLFSMVIYLAVLLLTHASMIMRIQIIRLAACMADCSWLLKGLERSDRYVLCTLMIRIADAVCVLLFVREGYAPLETYGLIQAAGTFVMSAVSLMYIRRMGFKFRFRTDRLSDCLNGSLKLFVPAAALKVFRIIDQGMLGILSTAQESGCYACADRIINIPFGIMEGLLVLLIPGAVRACGRKNDYGQYCSDSMTTLLSASVMISCGLFMVSRDAVTLLYGKGFEAVTGLSRLLSPFVILKTYTMVFRCLYLIPAGKQRSDTLMVCAAVVLNILLDFCVIPAYGAYGAATATVVSEAALMLMNISCCRTVTISKTAFLHTIAACICCLLIHPVLPDIPAVRLAADAVIWTCGAVRVIHTGQVREILKRIREDYGTE